MTRIGVAAAILLAVSIVAVGGFTPSDAASPGQFCSRVGTDDTLRPLPRALVTEARHLFGLDAMPARQVRRSTYVRCFNHRVLMCTVGANLPCGKADIRKKLPAATAWCAAHPGADIPAYVTGHASIYRWKCDGAEAVNAGAVLHVDSRGFVAEYWKAVN